MINELITVISREAALFESFLDLLERQKEALVANDAAALAALAERQHEKLAESRLLNRRRLELIASIQKDNALDGDVTVSRLLSLADEDQAERLRRLRDTILSLNEQINDVRNTNAMLLNQSREFVSRTMTMLSRINSPQPLYSRTSAVNDPTGVVAVDRRA